MRVTRVLHVGAKVTVDRSDASQRTGGRGSSSSWLCINNSSGRSHMYKTKELCMQAARKYKKELLLSVEHVFISRGMFLR